MSRVLAAAALAATLVASGAHALYVARDASHFLHRKVGSGTAIALVQAAGGAMNTGDWSEGIRVKGSASLIAPGTIIATFVQGHFDARHGHAAIYLSQDGHGIRVIDQWPGHPAAERVIPFGRKNAPPRDDGDAFHVVE